MAIQFVLEDGTGLANATSYADEVEALQYLENLGREAVFAALPDADTQRAHLNKGTAYIDQKYGPQIRGTRAFRDQALNVPRTGARDNAGFTILSDTVEAGLKAATIEAANRSAAGTDLSPDTAAGAGVIRRQKVKVGPIERDIAYSGGGASTLPRFPAITRILVDAGIIDSADRVYRR